MSHGQGGRRLSDYLLRVPRLGTPPLRQQTLLYGAGEGIQRGGELLLFVLLAGWLSAEEYGAVELLRVIGAWWSMVVLVGLGEAALRLGSDPRAGRAVFSTLACAVLGIGVVATTAAQGGLLALGGPDRVPPTLWHLLPAAMWSGVFFAYMLVGQAILQAQQRVSDYVAVQLSQGLTLLGGAAIVVGGFHLGPSGAVWTRLAAAVVAAILCWRLAFRSDRPALSSEVVIKGLRYGVPVFVHTLAWLALNSGDRFLLQHFATLDAVGTYGLGYSIGATLSLYIGVYNRSFMPVLFRSADLSTPLLRQRVARSFVALVTGSGACGAFLLLVVPGVLAMVGAANRYGDALTVVGIVAAAYTCLAAYQALTNVVWLARKTTYSMIATVSAAVVNVAVNLLLIPRYGVAGAAWATFISMLVLASTAYAAAKAVGGALVPGVAELTLAAVCVLLVLALGLMPPGLWRTMLSGGFGSLLALMAFRVVMAQSNEREPGMVAEGGVT